MYFLENVRLAFSSLKANKLRSVLTMLGIIIGISAVVTITTIGNSLKDTLNNAFNVLAGRSVYTTYMYINEEDTSITQSLTDDDLITREMLDEFEKQFEGRYLVSRTFGIGQGTMKNKNDKEVRISVSGASEGFIRANRFFYKLSSGRYPSEEDNAGKKHTIVVSNLFVEQYFGSGKNALGEDITAFIDGVGRVDFTIVGVFDLSADYIKYMGEKGKSKADILTPTFIPYDTATSLKAAPKHHNAYPEFYIADGKISIEDAEMEIESFFNLKYKNAKYWVPEFYDYAEMMEETNLYMNILTIVLAVIAAISLIVGGIGVMNIMMVSITERTREIGVRKAMGAKNKDIKIQFLIESAILCLVGGGIGVLCGMFNGFLVEKIGNILIQSQPDYANIVSLDIRVSVSAIIAALVFSTVIGLFFGIYPAGKAAKLDPIEALRYE